MKNTMINNDRIKLTAINETEEYKPFFEVVIKADSNDGDYITETSTFTEEEFTDEVIDAIKLLNEELSDDYALQEKYDDYYDRLLMLNIPYTDWGDVCHTLESVKIFYYDKDGRTFEVELV